jgi:hypothetical protein
MKTTSWKQEWYAHTLAIPELTVKTSINSQLEFEESSIMEPIFKTFEAVGKGIAIAQMDGPLPIADVAAMAITVFETASAWYDWIVD